MPVRGKQVAPEGAFTVLKPHGPTLNDYLDAVSRALGAIDIFVETTGSDATGSGSPRNPYLTIQKAIDVAPDFTRIHVGPGIFTEDILMDSRTGVHIKGVYPPIPTAGYQTVLTGSIILRDCKKCIVEFWSMNDGFVEPFCISIEGDSDKNVLTGLSIIFPLLIAAIRVESTTGGTNYIEDIHQTSSFSISHQLFSTGTLVLNLNWGTIFGGAINNAPNGTMIINDTIVWGYVIHNAGKIFIQEITVWWFQGVTGLALTSTADDDGFSRLVVTDTIILTTFFGRGRFSITGTTPYFLGLPMRKPETADALGLDREDILPPNTRDQYHFASDMDAYTRRAPVRAISTSNDNGAAGFDPTIGGAATFDGVVLITGDRVIVENTSESGLNTENGIWIVDTTGPWTRAEDMDLPQTDKILPGTLVYVEEGFFHAKSTWFVQSFGVVSGGSGTDYSAMIGNNFHFIRDFYDPEGYAVFASTAEYLLGHHLTGHMFTNTGAVGDPSLRQYLLPFVNPFIHVFSAVFEFCCTDASGIEIRIPGSGLENAVRFGAETGRTMTSTTVGSVLRIRTATKNGSGPGFWVVERATGLWDFTDPIEI